MAGSITPINPLNSTPAQTIKDKKGGKGLYSKYTVIDNTTHEVIQDCFVLRPDKDPTAEDALLFYAEATQNEELAVDLAHWLQELHPPQEAPTHESD